MNVTRWRLNRQGVAADGCQIWWPAEPHKPKPAGSGLGMVRYDIRFVAVTYST